MLQRDGSPTPLGEAIASYGRIFKSLHVLAYADDEAYRRDEAWVSVGDVADTSEFAVEAIRKWWAQMGTERFAGATRLLITADAGGSNGYLLRAWKVHLARLAAETGLDITCCHYPPGTSKWNRIVIYTGIPGVYEVTSEAPATQLVSL